jgi:hypothetical protein
MTIVWRARAWWMRLRLAHLGHYCLWQRNHLSDLCRNRMQSILYHRELATEAVIAGESAVALAHLAGIDRQIRELDKRLRAVGV